MSKSTYIFAFISFLVLFCLIAALFVSAIAPIVTDPNDLNGSYVRVPYSSYIPMQSQFTYVLNSDYKWHYNGDDISYLVLNGVGYLFLVIDDKSFGTTMPFGYGFPNVLLIYQIDLPNFNYENTDYHYYRGTYNLWRYLNDGNTLMLSSNLLYKGYVIPHNFFITNDPKVTIDTDSIVQRSINNYLENGRFFDFYECSVHNFFYVGSGSSPVTNDGEELNIWIRVTEDPNLNDGYLRIYFNALNTVRGFTVTFSNYLDYVSFPTFDWSYSGITSIFDLFKELFDYSQDVYNYIYGLGACFFYAINPFIYAV